MKEDVMGLVAHIDRTRNVQAYRILVRNSEGEKQLGRHKCRLEDIEIFLKEIVFDGADWMCLIQDREH
jgi:hypothetical protein